MSPDLQGDHLIRMDPARVKNLHITQSAGCQQLKLLEKLVGEKLFVRDRCGLIPTTRAIEIYHRIDGISRHSVIWSGRSSDPSPSPVIALVSPRRISSACPCSRNSWRSRADQSWLEFYIRAQGQDQIAQHVLTGEADIGISRLPLDERFFRMEDDFQGQQRLPGPAGSPSCGEGTVHRRGRFIGAHDHAGS